jgi:hypothetical protein
MAVQRVRRVIRKIDPWTVLKVSLVFNATMAVVFVLGTVIFWAIFVNAGIPQRINELALLIGLESGINLEGGVYFRIVTLLAVIGTVMLTGFMTLGAVVYNLISDLVGGIELIVLEETPSAHTARSPVAAPAMPQAPRRSAVRPGVFPPPPEPTGTAPSSTGPGTDRTPADATRQAPGGGSAGEEPETAAKRAVAESTGEAQPGEVRKTGT